MSLTACTTVNDFAVMSPYDRAEKTCNNSKEVKKIKKTIQELKTLANTASTNIARGHALQEQCYNRVVPKKVTGNCYQNNWGQISCDEYITNEVVTTCMTVPVPIDIDSEKSKVSKYNMLANGLQGNLDKILEGCIARVNKMPPEDAFYLWKNHLLPSPQ